MEAVKKDERIEKTEYTVVSLFAGAGGLDLGFEHQGFQVVWANDIDKDACETHRLWSDAEVVQGDVGKIDFSQIPKSHVITGGFPCQGFSLAGPRKIDDKRNSLYKYFVKLVEEKQPYVFVAENVKGILTLGDGTILEAIIEDFSERGVGYDVYPTLVNAADYGVPQDRWRVILIGIRKDLNIRNYEFPKKLERTVTLAEALKDLPKPEQEDICDAAYSSRYMSRNRKRGWNQVSYTIPAMSKQVALHPDSPDMKKVGEDKWEFGPEGQTRRFSWQEAAAIQTFPKGMQFEGNLTSKYKQIGNAVPVSLAEVIAADVRKILDHYFSTGEKDQTLKKKKASQTEKGKAFEYACLKAFGDILGKQQAIQIDDTKTLHTAREFYQKINAKSRDNMDQAARTAVRCILPLEPLLEYPDGNEPLYLSIQEDAKGIRGDVRDVVCCRKQIGWELGFSCKHNHMAVKHSRLSQQIDFGMKWFGRACSQAYFDEISPIFTELEAKRGKVKWSEMGDKEKRIYIPLLDAFQRELNRLADQYPDEIPGSLIQYLLGRDDFYKVIMMEPKKRTSIQAYNLKGTMNRPAKQKKPGNKVKMLKLPSKFYDISYKEGSGNTINVTCDGGWALSFRIHSAKSMIEPSLKFDVQLLGIPQDLFKQEEMW